MDLMSASLIYDYSSDDIVVPERLLPAKGGRAACEERGQLQGTVAEKTSEVAGRACYDSLGAKRSRKSEDYHAHILEVRHGSVLEHYNYTVEYDVNQISLGKQLLSLINRPGFWVEYRADSGRPSLRVTMNLRALVEWHFWDDVPETVAEDAQVLGAALRDIGHGVAPHIIVPSDADAAVEDKAHIFRASFKPRVVPPETQNEKWVTMLLTGSRGFSHELVRHGDWTAISQRSTRYVDEDGSEYVLHPLIEKYLQEMEAERDADPEGKSGTLAQMAVSREADAETYRRIVSDLQPRLIAEGVDKFTARKQARGAARGYLGNALYTEVVFSASVKQWHRMLRQRACQAADAEIRQVFCQVLDVLKTCQYADEFASWSLADSSDGIGRVGVEA